MGKTERVGPKKGLEGEKERSRGGIGNVGDLQAEELAEIPMDKTKSVEFEIGSIS